MDIMGYCKYDQLSAIGGLRRRLMMLTALLGAALFFSAIACSTDGSSDQESRYVVGSGGLRPSWDAAEMTERAEAVIVGTLSEELVTHKVPIGTSGMTSASAAHTYRNFTLEVERVFMPAQGVPENVALMIEAGLTPLKEGVVIQHSHDIPEVSVGDRILVFVEPVHEETLEMEEVTVPAGFSQDNYFRVMMSANVAILRQDGSSWTDRMTGYSIANSDLEQLVADKATAAN